jgi:hypothetical protein
MSAAWTAGAASPNATVAARIVTPECPAVVHFMEYLRFQRRFRGILAADCWSTGEAQDLRIRAAGINA